MIRAGVIGCMAGLIAALAGSAQYYLRFEGASGATRMLLLSQVLMWLSWTAGFLLALAGAFLIWLGYEVRKW